MNKSLKLFLTVIFIFLMCVIFDTSLSGIFKTYFTIMLMSFLIVKIKKDKLILTVLVIAGIITDTIFSPYIGPFTLSFLIGYAAYKIIKTYFPITDLPSYLISCAIILFLLSLRAKFSEILTFEVINLSLSIPVYYLLNFFVNRYLLEKGEVE